MTQFPKAKPTKGTRKRAAPKSPLHVFVWSPDSDWRGQPFCAVNGCGQPRNNPAHDLSRVPDSSEVDARKLGEGA